jgi:hypothetical protein
MLGADWGTGEFLWSLIWFTLFFIWIWILIAVFADIFRSKDLGGFAKFLWIFFVIFMPYLGVFVYLIARGHKMSEHAAEQAAAMDAAQKAYIRDAVGGGGDGGSAAELERLAALKANGTIDEAEFQKLKAQIVG